MEIKKEVVTTVKDSNGNDINRGDVCIVAVKGGKTYIGIFTGLTNKNNLEFKNILTEELFAVSPKSVLEIKAGVVIE